MTTPTIAGRAELDRAMAASPSLRYARFLGLAVLIVAGLCLVGLVPTRRLAGDGAILAMVAGCIISLVSAALAGWLITAVGADTPNARLQRSFLAMMVRLAVVVVLGVAAALSGTFERTALLVWIAIAYVALLPLEVQLAIAAD
jgi:hypothetical protein